MDEPRISWSTYVKVPLFVGLLSLWSGLMLIGHAHSLGPSATKGEFISLLSDKRFRGWEMVRVEAKAENDVVRVTGTNGWMRTQRVFSDFVLRMDVRLVDSTTKAGVFVRTWPTVAASGKWIPNNGYRVSAIDRVLPDDPLTLLVGHGVSGRQTVFTKEGLANALRPTGEWQSYEIECIADRLRVILNGMLVLVVEKVENPAGHVAFQVERGTVEFRDVLMREIPVAEPEGPEGVYRMKDPMNAELKPPRVAREVKPSYTPQALAAHIQGFVLLAAVVTAEGTVVDVQLLRSLDPKYGLDAQAIDAAKQWRFKPGTLSGKPVPVLIRIEMAFTLKR